MVDMCLHKTFNKNEDTKEVTVQFGNYTTQINLVNNHIFDLS